MFRFLFQLKPVYMLCFGILIWILASCFAFLSFVTWWLHIPTSRISGFHPDQFCFHQGMLARCLHRWFSQVLPESHLKKNNKSSVNNKLYNHTPQFIKQHGVGILIRLRIFQCMYYRGKLLNSNVYTLEDGF